LREAAYPAVAGLLLGQTHDAAAVVLAVELGMVVNRHTSSHDFASSRVPPSPMKARNLDRNAWYGQMPVM
jgi:hypothetical protein